MKKARIFILIALVIVVGCVAILAVASCAPPGYTANKLGELDTPVDNFVPSVYVDRDNNVACYYYSRVSDLECVYLGE